VESRQPGQPSRTATVLRLVAAALAIAALAFAGRQAGAAVPRFALWVDCLGAWGPAAFMAGYVVAAVAFVPGSLLTLAGGAIFGLLRGTIYVFVAALVGACAAFLVSRYLVRGAIEKRLQGEARFAAIDRAVAAEGRKIVLLLRLSPLIPFNLLNYTLGITRVTFRDFVIGSVGMLPGTLLYVYYGKLAGDVAALAGGAPARRDARYYVLLGAGLVATIAVTTLVTRAARAALRQSQLGRSDGL
jgi:uncharacterized membrane protein YdjX (TVP38/TMEM64 family)